MASKEPGGHVPPKGVQQVGQRAVRWIEDGKAGRNFTDVGRKRGRRSLRSVDLLLPYAEGARLAELHDIAGDLERTDTAEGVRVHARVPATLAERYERFSVNGSPA